MTIRSLLLFCIIIIGSFLYFCTNEDNSVKVMSFNIRYSNPEDGINAWTNRKGLVYDFLDDKQPDIIGFQEVLKSQLDDLSNELIDYEYIGVGRDDGRESGEFVPVFYAKDKFELLASSHFWLSETPEIAGSKSWGAVLPRIVTWLQLKDKNNGYIFYVFNTHFSHVSAFARNESAILLLNKIKTIAGKAPVVLMGDFNAQPSERMYSTLTDNWEGYLQLWDTRYLPIENDEANFQTFNGFKHETPEVVIDHIFTNGFFDVKSFSTHHVIKNDVFISDHYPIMAQLDFRLNRRSELGNRKKLIQNAQVPIITPALWCFYDSVLVEIKPQGTKADIYYTLNDEQPDTLSAIYAKPLILKESSTIKAKSFADNMYPSSTVTTTVIKKKRSFAELTEVIPEADEKYFSKGYGALFDDKRGNDNQLNDGSWCGFNGTDNDFLFDLGRKQTITELYISSLSQPAQWIVAPSKIEVKTSNDGIRYKTIAQKKILPSFDEAKSERLLFHLPLNSSARYVKISVYNGGLLPKSHSGSGNPSWFFIDELILQ
ncbi:endonuclease/exonuclease/phosphatase family protein [Carboxylicivirga sp. A043]|uniref:endonuclease/exonuclease/phosphatase family protein n=1 Tax=Carboxylicivirga litoralis TaxID=2816963 RepID=UPI0021CB48D2|nr:endonuclease/exonuclease/phosphatase family protein [Carboxylicivirga sp. A043]MCU4156455.1 endonuclease/exonuclease/phosphatase family protein [Carboxylicivirga sp. A043]